MAEPARCPDCGTELPSDGAIAGLCPQCLFSLALQDSDPERAVDELPTLEGSGRILGERYQMRELLGRGGMGEVWRAFDLKLRVDVALKSIRPERAERARARELLRQEVRSARGHGRAWQRGAGLVLDRPRNGPGRALGVGKVSAKPNPRRSVSRKSQRKGIPPSTRRDETGEPQLEPRSLRRGYRSLLRLVHLLELAGPNGRRMQRAQRAYLLGDGARVVNRPSAWAALTRA